MAFDLDLGKYGMIEKGQRQASEFERSRGIPQAVEMGGTGDVDMRRFYGQELSMMQLCQSGAGGTACGYVTTVMGPVPYKQGAHGLTKNTNPTMFGHTYLEATSDFLKSVTPTGSSGDVNCTYSSTPKPFTNPITGEIIPAPTWPGVGCQGGRVPQPRA